MSNRCCSPSSGQTRYRVPLCLVVNTSTAWCSCWCLHAPYISAQSSTFFHHSDRKYKNRLVFMLMSKQSLYFRPELYIFSYHSGQKYRHLLVLILMYKRPLHLRTEWYIFSYHSGRKYEHRLVLIFMRKRPWYFRPEDYIFPTTLVVNINTDWYWYWWVNGPYIYDQNVPFFLPLRPRM